MTVTHQPQVSEAAGRRQNCREQTMKTAGRGLSPDERAARCVDGRRQPGDRRRLKAWYRWNCKRPTGQRRLFADVQPSQRHAGRRVRIQGRRTDHGRTSSPMASICGSLLHHLCERLRDHDRDEEAHRSAVHRRNGLSLAIIEGRVQTSMLPMAPNMFHRLSRRRHRQLTQMYDDQTHHIAYAIPQTPDRSIRPSS